MRKRILAFVLAMVMTCVNICMGGTSGMLVYAEGIDTEEAGISIKAVEEAKAGEQVTIEVVANKEMYWNAFKLCLNLNSEKLKTEKEEIQAIPGNYDSKSGEWQIWKCSSYKPTVLVDNWVEKDNNYLIAGVAYSVTSTISMDRAKIEKDAVLLSLKAEAKVDLKAGDVIATCTLPEGYTDDRYEEYDPYRKKEVGLSVDCKVVELPKVTITFEVNGGNVIQPIEVIKGTVPKVIETPTREGYIFRGWYTDSACETEFDETAPVESDITLYAMWEEDIPIIESDFVIKNGVLEKYNGMATEVTIPEGVTEIGDKAFEGCSHVTYIEIPDGVTSIGMSAFSGCSALADIQIPESVTKIAGDAFAGNSSELTIYGEEGSYAQEFANANQIPFKILGNEEGEDIISAEEMIKLVEKNKTEDVAVETSSGITFTFKQGSMDNAEITDSIDFGTTINHDYGSLVNAPFEEGEHAFTITYNYEGKLPGEAQISIPVDDSLTGKRLYYYEIDENGEYKYISRTTVAADGTYTVKQNECSGSYVATTKAPEKLGDCDGEEGITSKDALAILKHSLGLPQEHFIVELADCDGEDGITSKDALAVLKYNLGIQDEFY